MNPEVMKDQLKVEGQEERRTRIQEGAHSGGPGHLAWTIRQGGIFGCQV